MSHGTLGLTEPIDPDWDDDPVCYRLHFETHDSIGGYEIDDCSISGKLPFSYASLKTEVKTEVKVDLLRSIPDYQISAAKAEQKRYLRSVEEEKEYRFRQAAYEQGLHSKEDYIQWVHDFLGRLNHEGAIQIWIDSNGPRFDQKMFGLTSEEIANLYDFAAELRDRFLTERQPLHFWREEHAHYRR
jgi:hypothetical protein